MAFSSIGRCLQHKATSVEDGLEWFLFEVGVCENVIFEVFLDEIILIDLQHIFCYLFLIVFNGRYYVALAPVIVFALIANDFVVGV